MSKCIVMSAGDFRAENLHKEPGDIVIAADNGLMYLTQMGLQPDYLIGDYDSLQEGMRGTLEVFRTEHPDRERLLPKAKDDTDTMAAVRWGFELGYRDFRLYGALGGRRVDHTISNLQTLLFIASHGGHGAIVSERQILFPIRNEKRVFRKGLSGMFSLFAAEPSVIVTIRGMLFDCEELEFNPDFPIGCSNQFLPDRTATVEVKGTALAAAERQQTPRKGESCRGCS